jgi:two-component system chemotaxis response regulator CheY
VVQVENAEDAKRTLEQEAVDLVIAEWRLCRQAGLELLEIARRRAEAVQRRIPVIVLGSDQDEHQAGLEAGADVFLRRPFPARGLLATLQALLLPTA